MKPEFGRPDPDQILASLKAEKEAEKKGHLKIFFGMCAGVGKTFTMLQAGIAEKGRGADVVNGYIEPHNRPETKTLAANLESVPRKTIEYKGSKLEEMDLDAILSRHPAIALIDELAHTNAPGSRHSKRYQDVIEILDHGIDVYTTLNVQHIESRSEAVAQITGIVVRETLPDEVFENADEVEIIDIAPDQLIERFNEGKVYTPERSAEALQSFFRKGNLTALREMSLRLVADRVDKQLKRYMQQKNISGPWKSGMHLLAAVSPSPLSARLLRWAKNLSYTMGARLTVVYVETTKTLLPEQQEQLRKNLNLARQLGADIIVTSGNDIVKAILTVAQRENITHIIIGKSPAELKIPGLFKETFVHRLIRQSGNIDVYVVGAENSAGASRLIRTQKVIPTFTASFDQYLITALTILLTSALCFTFRQYLGYQSVSFILLFVVSILATMMGIGPVMVSSTLSALIWDFFFIPPQFTLHIERTEDILMLGMFFTIALVNGVLTARVRRQERLTRDREERTSALYQITRNLSVSTNLNEMAETSSSHIKKYFGFETVFFLQNEFDNEYIYTGLPKADLTDNEINVAEWVFRHGRCAGKYTDTLPIGKYTFYPLSGNKLKSGVLAVKLTAPLSGEQEQFWDTFITQISTAFEREFLDETARKVRFLDESDKLYKTLFNSISHELRIPVATVMGSADSLLNTNHDLQTIRALSSEIFQASVRLNRLIENLLNMSRLESGRISPRPDWCDIHDLINEVINDLSEELKGYNLQIVVPDDMPLVKLDFGLIEQVLYNLVVNATQYAPHNTTLRIKAYYDNGFLAMEIMDRGPGFPTDSLPYIFDKFYRVNGAKTGGIGLGLSIVKGFIEAHNGTIEVRNRRNGGAYFTIKIPSEKPEIIVQHMD